MRRVLLFACLALLSCAGATTPPPGPAQRLLLACPLGVPNTRIRVIDTTEGVDLLFTTTTGSVEELRERVGHQARRYGPEHREGLGHGGRHGYVHRHGLRLWSMPKARANVADDPTGARLTLVPIEPSDRTELRQAVIRRVALLEAHGCPD